MSRQKPFKAWEQEKLFLGLVEAMQILEDTENTPDPEVVDRLATMYIIMYNALLEYSLVTTGNLNSQITHH